MHSFPLEDAKRSIMAPDKATNVQIDTVQNQPKRQDEQEDEGMNDGVGVGLALDCSVCGLDLMLPFTRVHRHW